MKYSVMGSPLNAYLDKNLNFVVLRDGKTCILAEHANVDAISLFGPCDFAGDLLQDNPEETILLSQQVAEMATFCSRQGKTCTNLLTCDTCEVRPQFPSWILRTKLRQVTRSLPTVDHARLASSMPILRRPCPRLPLRASLWMKILIESLMSSAHLFGGRPRGRADPLGSHSDTIFAHLSYFMRDTCPAHFSRSDVERADVEVVAFPSVLGAV
uniref:Carn_acyltransf domain-containing protein n=1 Tax=Caenorhabditis japonica TaxID=281687 RepID=A0A8R1I0Z8_CAEJA